MTNSITTLQTDAPGPAVAIFAGVHGNEKAGIRTIDYLRQNLKLINGTVYLVYANPRAIKQDVRFTEKNLNRCFQLSAEVGDTYEEKRAVALMKLLDSCDALLDLHAYNEPYGEATPFVISEPNAKDIVKTFDVSYVINGIDAIEKGGTDGYMSNQNKIGICVELGAIGKPEEYVDLGIQTSYQFLQYFGMVDNTYKPSNTPQTILQVQSKYVRKYENFSFAANFMTFDEVSAGQLICTDGGKEVRAETDAYLLFPGGNNPVGVEAYVTAVGVI